MTERAREPEPRTACPRCGGAEDLRTCPACAVGYHTKCLGVGEGCPTARCPGERGLPPGWPACRPLEARALAAAGTEAGFFSAFRRAPWGVAAAALGAGLAAVACLLATGALPRNIPPLGAVLGAGAAIARHVLWAKARLAALDLAVVAGGEPRLVTVRPPAARGGRFELVLEPPSGGEARTLSLHDSLEARAPWLVGLAPRTPVLVYGDAAAVPFLLRTVDGKAFVELG